MLDREDPVLDVADALRSLILDGTFGAGARLREVALAERLGISRTPIRQAMIALEREGLLIYELNKGFSVRAFGFQDLEHAFDMRALLEGYICRETAERGLSSTSERRLLAGVAAVDTILAKWPPRPRPAEFAAWRQANAEFHGTLLEQVSNPLLTRLLATVQRMPLAQHGLALPRDVTLLRRYNAQHREILLAITHRQGGRAEFLMREHVRQALEELRPKEGNEVGSK